MTTIGNQSRVGLTWKKYVPLTSLSLKWTILIVSTLIIQTSSMSQGCNHQHLENLSQNYLRELHVKESAQHSVNRSSMELIKLKVFILRDNQGNPGPYISYANVLNELEKVNQYYEPINIRFEVCCEPTYVNNSNLVYPSQAFEDFANANDDPAYINLYMLHTNNSSFPGYAYYPGYKSRMMFEGAWVLGFAHDLGHVLGLFHTFGPTWSLTDELVDGSNCQSAGDLICDTPSDPYPFGSYDLLSCQYTGTILDANGDPYNPLMDNIMNYYTGYAGSPCQKTFTQGQFDFMSSIYETSRFYYDGDSTTFNLKGFPGSLCLGDSTSYDLSRYAEDAVFSGPGITNNTLQISGLSAGTYTVTVTDTSPSYDSALVTDAAQIAYGTYLDTNYLWQAYKAIRSGIIDHVQLRFANATSQNITLKIYAGTGTSGTLLFNNSFPVSADTNNRWVKFSLNTTVQQTSGNIYTLEWTTSNGSIRLNHAYNDITYGGGVSNKQEASSIGTANNTGYSWTYLVSCLTNEHRCTNPMSFEFIIHEPMPGFIDFFPYNLTNRFCVDEAPLDIEDAYNTYNYYDSIMINGVRTNILNPDSIGPGVHSYSFKYHDYNGCKFTADTNLWIKGYPPLGVEPNMCITDTPIDWASIHPNGSFWVDGQPTSVFNPTALGSGTHTVEATIPNPIDTTYASRNIVGYWSSLLEDSLETNEMLAQTFVADTSAYIQGVKITTSSYKQSQNEPDFQIEITIRTDSGFNGTLLYQDTLALGSVFGETEYVIPDYERIELMKDSFYTIALRRLDSNNSVNWIRYIYEPNYTANPGKMYRNGQFHEIGDFGFKLKYWLEHHCGEYQTYSINISDAPPTIGLDDQYEACDSITLSAGAALSYLWSDSSTNPVLSVYQSGTYWVKASNGCEKSDTTEVSIHSTPVLTNISGEANAYADSTYVYSTTGATSSVFNWTVTNGSILYGQGTQMVGIEWDSSYTQGMISVSETSEYDCQSDPITKSVSIEPLIIGEHAAQLNVMVYPNPTHDVLMIRSALSATLELKLYNILGQVVLTNKMLTNQHALDVESLPSGQYFLEISDEKAMQRRFSVIKS